MTHGRRAEHQRAIGATSDEPWNDTGDAQAVTREVAVDGKIDTSKLDPPSAGLFRSVETETAQSIDSKDGPTVELGCTYDARVQDLPTQIGLFEQQHEAVRPGRSGRIEAIHRAPPGQQDLVAAVTIEVGHVGRRDVVRNPLAKRDEPADTRRIEPVQHQGPRPVGIARRTGRERSFVIRVVGIGGIVGGILDGAYRWWRGDEQDDVPPPVGRRGKGIADQSAREHCIQPGPAPGPIEPDTRLQGRCLLLGNDQVGCER
jgi:hypothetical protein